MYDSILLDFCYAGCLFESIGQVILQNRQTIRRVRNL
jgi:hypothetical protein